MTSLKTSLRNTGWRRYTPKINLSLTSSIYQLHHFINLSKSDISPEWLYHSRSRFSKKLMVSVRVSCNKKLISFSLIRRKQKLTRTVTLICWRLPYCLNVSTLCRQWHWIPARQCSVTPRKSDVTVSTTEHSRLHSCWWMGIIFFRS